MNFKKYFFLFIVLGFFVLLLPETSLAVITGSGCERDDPVMYETECGENFSIGGCDWECCDTDCCEWDDEGNCTDTCCVDHCWDCSCQTGKEWDEYKCNSSDCDGDIQIRTCNVYKSGSCNGGCDNEKCCVDCSGSDTCENCGSWQKPVSDSCSDPECEEWCETRPECKCCPECIDEPDNLRHCLSPDCSIVAGPSVKLPVKLDWDDVPGWWGGGWSGAGSNIQQYADCQRGFIDFCWEEAKALNPDWNCQGELIRPYLECLRRETASSCESVLQDDECTTTCPALGGEDECYEPGEFVQSYVIEISGGELRLCDGTTTNSYTEVLDASEFFAPCPCFFESGQNYTWKVKACCGVDGTNCGDWSSRSFSANLAPEPVRPYDPDWADLGWAEPNWTSSTYPEFPVELGWCEVDGASSYLMKTYREGEEYCPQLLCPMIINPALITFPQDPDLPTISIYFDLDSFTKGVLYDWEMATCSDELCESYGDFSQRWRFSGTTTLAKVELISPENDGCTNLSSRLEWKHVGGARSYLYTINEVPALQNVLTTSTIISFEDIWGNLGLLDLNATYTWQVVACWDENGLYCEETSRSDEWTFTTTGAVPTSLDVTEKDPATGNALVPIKLNWDDVPCAAFYKYEVALDNSFSDIKFDGLLAGSEVSVDYDADIGHPKQNTPYWWRVRTCADTEGNVCGDWASADLTTFELAAPTNPHPPDNGEFYTYEYYLKWDSVLGGAFYQYEIVGKIGTTTVPSNSAFIDTSVLELITYTWSVRACIDENCQEASPNISTWSFTLVEGEAPAGKGGIVPCGRYTDNPNTPWNERDHCGIQHVFIMIFSIIDFLLWKVLPIVLVLLALASGVIFYFSGQLGITHPPSQVKSLWKAAGIGLAVIFLAWIGISLILGLFGYQVGLFGPWWKIEF